MTRWSDRKMSPRRSHWHRRHPTSPAPRKNPGHREGPCVDEEGFPEGRAVEEPPVAPPAGLEESCFSSFDEPGSEPSPRPAGPVRHSPRSSPGPPRSDRPNPPHRRRRGHRRSRSPIDPRGPLRRHRAGRGAARQERPCRTAYERHAQERGYGGEGELPAIQGTLLPCAGVLRFLGLAQPLDLIRVARRLGLYRAARLLGFIRLFLHAEPFP